MKNVFSSGGGQPLPPCGSGCSRCSVSRRLGSHVCCTRIEGLTVQLHGTRILDNINLHIHCGELTAIVGRNGAGKTTFLRALLNEIPHEGSISFMQDKAVSARRPRFGYVPQTLPLDAGSPVSVSDMALACLISRPVWFPRRKRDRELALDVLAAVCAEELIDRRVCDLSGGELQRVMLSLAIHPLPDILLLDEPVSGVDRNGLSFFYELVSALRRSHDITILLISHDLDLVARYADKVVLIDGKIAAEGVPREVYADPQFVSMFGHIALDEEENRI